MEQILIVEDDTDINNMVASALTKAGYESIAKELVERLNGFITGNVMNDTFTVSITFQIQK